MRKLVQLTIFGFRLAPILLAVYWIMLFTGTHLPGSSVKSIHVNDKMLHFLAFAGLSFLLAWSIPSRLGFRRKGPNHEGPNDIETNDIGPNQQKLGHKNPGRFGQGGMGAREFPGIVVAIAITVVYAAIDEWSQGFVPSRTSDIRDFLADMLGMTTGLVAYLALRRALFLQSRNPTTPAARGIESARRPKSAESVS
jgi:hypothetical protein